MKNRGQLEDYLEQKLNKVIVTPARMQEAIGIMVKEYQIPMGIAVDVLGLRVGLPSLSDDMLYKLYATVNKISKVKIANEYFTETEVALYEATRMAEPKRREIFIPCIPVGVNQWIGTMDSDLLIQMSREQFIRYNTNAQRVMTRMSNHGQEFYKITINKKTLREITDLLLKGEYIPDPITLNIPLEQEDGWRYDKKRQGIVLDNLDHIDISDGYHRYLAYCKAKEVNPDFVYPLEVRITHFDEFKIKQFIFQMDQKTKMSKVASNSMNQNSLSNIVTERINSDTTFLLKGNINRNEGLISFIHMTNIIDCIFLRRKKMQLDSDPARKSSYALEIQMKVVKAFNEYLTLNPEKMGQKIPFEELFGIVYVAANDKEIQLIDVIAEVQRNHYDEFKPQRTAGVTGSYVKRVEFYLY